MNQKSSSTRMAETMERTRRERQRAAKPEAPTHLDMHADHRRWLSDHCMWRDDVAAWQKEFEQAFEKLKRLTDTLQGHQQAMAAHLKTVDTQEQAHKEHEQVLAKFEQGNQGSGLTMLTMAKAHHKHALAHVNQQNAHERLKRYHHTLMAHLSSLLKAIR